jgi:hypothetical protein
MAFKGRDQVRSKIITNSDIIDQLNTFIEPGSPISYQNEKEITVKISKFLPVTGIINKTLKSFQVQKLK